MDNVRRLTPKAQRESIPINGAIHPELSPTAPLTYLEDLDQADFTPKLWDTADTFAAKHPELSPDIADRLVDAQRLIYLASESEAAEALEQSLEDLAAELDTLPEIDARAFEASNITVLGRGALSSANPTYDTPAKILKFPTKE